jgi:limonene-1,2-epoxide hydrolase
VSAPAAMLRPAQTGAHAWRDYFDMKQFMDQMAAG